MVSAPQEQVDGILAKLRGETLIPEPRPVGVEPGVEPSTTIGEPPRQPPEPPTALAPEPPGPPAPSVLAKLRTAGEQAPEN